MDYEDSKKTNTRAKAKKVVLVISGSVLLALGALGIFLPVLPTTPFVIGAALCYSGSATSVYSRLIKNKYFGPYIENYKTQSGVPVRVKIQALIMLWCLLLVSIIFVPEALVKYLLGAVGVGVTIHLLTIKTKKKP